MTLRQEIEKIVDKYKGFRIYERSAEDLVDEVLEAIGKTADGMPTVERGTYHNPEDRGLMFENGVEDELTECQAYWQKELGK